MDIKAFEAMPGVLPDSERQGERNRERGGGERKERKRDICCGKTFLPASNSLALMKSWDREGGAERSAERVWPAAAAVSVTRSPPPLCAAI